jgi:hypothetical protein
MQELASDRDVQFRSLQQTRYLLGQQQCHLLSLSLVLDFLALVGV